MNREILFRGKNVYTNKWEYGFFSKNQSLVASPDKILELCFIEKWANPESPDTPNTQSWAPIREDSAGQYVGLKDCKGNRIFEGDIVRVVLDKGVEKEIEFDGYCQVDYSDRFVCFVINGTCNGYGISVTFSSLLPDGEIEVVGNIFDNPELLKEVE